MLQSLNTKSVGAAGLTVGVGAVIASVTGLFKLLSDPNYLTALFTAAMDHRKGDLTPVDIQTYSQLAGACVSVVGAIIVALIAANVGKSVFNKDSAASSSGNTSGGVTAGNSAEGK